MRNASAYKAMALAVRSNRDCKVDMNIIHTQIDNIDILNLSGRVDATTSPDFESQLLDLARATKSGVVLDFNDVEYVSSAGLRVLLVGVRRLHGLGRAFVVARPSDNVKEVITMTGFHKLLTICGSMDEAFKAVQGKE